MTAFESDLHKGTLRAQEEILSEMKSDGKNVAKLVSYFTLTFLPGSFLSVSDSTPRQPYDSR